MEFQTTLRALLMASALLMSAYAGAAALVRPLHPVFAREVSTTRIAAQSEAGQFSDKQLQEFVSAYRQVQQIRQEYDRKLEQRPSPRAAEKMVEDEDERMRSAIQSNGLDIDTYLAIVRKANSSPQLRKRLRRLLQARQS